MMITLAMPERCPQSAKGDMRAPMGRPLLTVKLNYEIHGNTIPHLHMHLYPRSKVGRAAIQEQGS
jgi:diadenosine tetraphosphate (Ap4A) HIT family hydrolase